ncbi:MAG: hypothetical protein JNK72_08115 [Myxococcales bacterium]|nr:hypothetical protein [Myxococcales bacterium]
MNTRAAFGLSVALTAALSLGLGGCTSNPDGEDLFRVAADGVPGGALLAAWSPAAIGSTRSYLVGGYVGVDPSRVSGRGGRLVEYNRGQFRTLCQTDRALWWVDGGEGEVWAVGDGGTVLRWVGGRCETLATGLRFAEGEPTFWGVRVVTPRDVWLVGGSAQPTGPTGVLVHYDGQRFERVAGLPEAAAGLNFYKVTTLDDSLVIAASQGMIFERSADGAWRTEGPLRVGDARLFTVTCARDLRGPACLAVGGAASGLAVRRDLSGRWVRANMIDEEMPGLNGAFYQDASNLFVVGNHGATMHSNGESRYVSRPLTQATLHGVGGNGAAVFAVGGELGVADPSQRGVVLIRGENQYPSFGFDGLRYVARGTLRASVGGAGQ